MATFIVSQRIDGRGGIKPFGTYGTNQAGSKVDIGLQNKNGSPKLMTVTKDGRVNIPKSVFDKVGIKGKDGRKRISITFSTAGGTDGWNDVKAIAQKPLSIDKNLNTYDRQTKFRTTKQQASGNGDISDLDYEGEELKPSDSGDYNWSP